nr:hypothetical protein [Gemmatimonadaceae bacterium]
ALCISGKYFYVILSDLMMPDMTGMDLFDELVQRHLDLKQAIAEGVPTGGVRQRRTMCATGAVVPPTGGRKIRSSCASWEGFSFA